MPGIVADFLPPFCQPATPVGMWAAAFVVAADTLRLHRENSLNFLQEKDSIYDEI
ncbi:hypothetical protein [Bradyrhizobium canariense]|uniref:Uncharacterized protein n=1 Tax=Bradyrhizobium canariense TaxID=255045 RepID=A0A1H1T616_9BRAD|nr:hypothetical protein [Bradyrhizobium canariense]SDS55456.1 hypothetical protein SAMN05444158_2413 [Bradyrhizobium canariense]